MNFLVIFLLLLSGHLIRCPHTDDKHKPLWSRNKMVTFMLTFLEQSMPLFSTLAMWERACLLYTQCHIKSMNTCICLHQKVHAFIRYKQYPN